MQGKGSHALPHTGTYANRPVVGARLQAKTVTGVHLVLQGQDTIIDMPPAAAPAKAPKQARQKRAAGAGGAQRQSLGAVVWWAGLTFVGMLYISLVLSLCAWPVVHAVVELGYHASIVRFPPHLGSMSEVACWQKGLIFVHAGVTRPCEQMSR